MANRKKMGVTAMKIFSQDRLQGKAPAEQLIRYVLSLPVSAAVIGMPQLKYLEENVRIVKTFQPMPESEMRDLSDHLSKTYKAGLDRFFRHHEDA